MLKIFRGLDKAIQRARKGYSGYDLWGLDYYLQIMIPKAIMDFESTLHGSPELEFEEIDTFDYSWVIKQYDEILKNLKKDKWFDEYSYEDEAFKELTLDNCYIKFRIILRRIAYCFTESNEELCSQVNEYEDEYLKQRFNDNEDLFIPLEDNLKLYKLNVKKVDEELDYNYTKRQLEIEQYIEDMKNQAFELLSKYFFYLWD